MLHEFFYAAFFLQGEKPIKPALRRNIKKDNAQHATIPLIPSSSIWNR
jgi:hypothetical protein